MAVLLLRTARSPSSAKLLLLPVRTTIPMSFSSSGETRDDDNLHQESRSVAVDRRARGEPIPSIFLDALDPLYQWSRLSQVLNCMDSPMWAGGGGGGVRRGWDAREDDEGLYLRVDMPGLGKEDVRVTVEEGTLVIKGKDREQEQEQEQEQDGGRTYTGRIDLPERVYVTDKIRAEMKNGVLRVVVPKVKEEDRTNVIHVNVE